MPGCELDARQARYRSERNERISVTVAGVVGESRREGKVESAGARCSTGTPGARPKRARVAGDGMVDGSTLARDATDVALALCSGVRRRGGGREVVGRCVGGRRKQGDVTLTALKYAAKRVISLVSARGSFISGTAI